MLTTKPHNNTIIKCYLNHKTTSSLLSSKSPLESLSNTIWNALRKPAAVAILIGFLLMCIPNIALAASGGRMGGSFFSPSSKSSSSPLDSYSVPTRSRGFSYSASPKGSSFSSSSKSSSCSSSSSQGFSYSAPFNGSSSSSDSYSVPTRSKGYSGEVYVGPTNTDEFDDFYGFLVLIFSVVYWSFYFLVLKVPGFILISIINKKYYCNKYLLVFLVLSLVCGYLFQSSSEEKPPSLNVRWQGESYYN